MTELTIAVGRAACMSVTMLMGFSGARCYDPTVASRLGYFLLAVLAVALGAFVLSRSGRI